MIAPGTTLLRLRSRHLLKARAPFNFRLSIWKPSHFRTDLETHTLDVSWRTFRLPDAIVGVRLEAHDLTGMSATIYSDRCLGPGETDGLIERLRFAYGLDDDLGSFNQMWLERFSGRIPTPLRGMRISCPESVFEIAVVSLLLQNTTIARTTQMMKSLLRSYGSVIRFDQVRLRAFFSPRDMLHVTEEQLRLANRLGYRAKYLPEFAAHFGCSIDDLTRVPLDELILDLQNIKGIGAYSAGVIASSALRDTSAVPLDVWNVRILHDALFGVDGDDRDAVRAELTASFPGFEGLAALYLVEAAYLDSPVAPLHATVGAARRASWQ